MANEQDLQRTIDEQRVQLATIEASSRRAAATAGIATALQAAGHTLAPGAASQLTALFADEVVVHREGDRLIPTGPGLMPISDFVKERLARPEYSHFIRGSAPAGNQAGAQQPEQGGIPMNLSDAVIRTINEARAVAGGAGAAPPTTNMSRPFGLRRA